VLSGWVCFFSLSIFFFITFRFHFRDRAELVC
jgi:hypothetical protein